MSEDIKYSGVLPVQTISYSDKIKNDFEWAKKTAMAYVYRAGFTNTNHKLALKKLFDYYNGNIHDDDYKIITEPFGKKLDGDWSNIINYPILKPKVDILLGEYIKRPKNVEVYVTNDDVTNQVLEEKNKKIFQTLEQMFVNKVNEAGVDTGIPSEEVQMPEDVEKDFVSSYRDKRAMLGQNSLNYISQYCKLSEKFHTMFFYWLVTGEVYSYKTVENNEPYYEVVNVLDLQYDQDPDQPFLEDGDWVMRDKLMTVSAIVDFFYDDFGDSETKIKDMIDRLETLSNNMIGTSVVVPTIGELNARHQLNSRLLTVRHITWKSKVKKGICSFVDEYGQMQSLEVDETFKPDKEANQVVDWFWVNEWWEIYLIGADIFLRARPIPVQRTSLDNISKCKGPYNGRKLSAINSKNTSLIILGIPFQIMYNATWHRLKLAMAKMKDDMIQLDVNAKPKNMSIEEWLLYADATNILFIDRSKEGYRESSTHQSVLKMASSTIQAYIELLRFTKSEWEEVCGISRQRQGQINTSETVGGVERAVLQSSLVTEIYYTLFDEFVEREYQGLLDYSKFAWVDGKKTSYILPESGLVTYLDVDPIEHSEAEYGIFVALSGKQIEKRKKLEDNLQNFIQNGAKTSDIIDIINSDNFVELKNKMLYAESKKEQYEQEMEKMKAEQQQQALAMQDELAEKQHQRELELIDRKGEWDLRGKEMMAFGMDEGDDNAAIAQVAIDAGIKQQEIVLKQQELGQKEVDSQRKASTEKYKADVSLKIAKENKQKGEK